MGKKIINSSIVSSLEAMLKTSKSVVFVLTFLLVVSHSNSCNFDVKVKQTLRNEGFHRNITYGIVFNGDEDQDSWPLQDCIIGLDQVLPPGVYANPDELGDLRRTGKLNVIPKTRINTELPAEQASASSVYIIGEVTDGKAYLWMPVHARYHQAVPGGGMARNEIDAPRMYLRCADARLARCAGAAVSFLCNGGSRDQCSWREVSYTMMTDTLVWEVPVGNTDHYYLVACGTALVVAVGSLYLLKGVHEYKVAVKKKA